jgi:hypothetical protein
MYKNTFRRQVNEKEEDIGRYIFTYCSTACFNFFKTPFAYCNE